MQHATHTYTGLVLALVTSLIAACGGIAGVTTTDSTPSLESDLRTVAETWQGTPYEPGGSDMSGIDQVTFVRRIYEEIFSIDLPRTPSRIAGAGQEVGREELQAGDILIFQLSSGPSHVGIYLGANEFAHVSIENGVTIDRIDQASWRTAFQVARRLDLPGIEPAQTTQSEQSPTKRRRTGW